MPIAATGLGRRFGARQAVTNVSMEVRRGEVVALVGRNGAGKSTTLHMLAGVLPAHTGSVSINDVDLFAQPGEARRHLGFLAEGSPVFAELNVTEFLFQQLRLRGFARTAARRLTAEALDRFDLGAVGRRLCGLLSTGERQRAGLAAALAHSPAALILDEPSNGLDPAQAAALHDLIRTEVDSAVLLSTHRLDEVANVCDRALVIEAGRLRESLTLREHDGGWLRVRLRGAAADSDACLRNVPGITDVEATADGAYRVRYLSRSEQTTQDAREEVAAGIARAVASAGLDLTALGPESPTAVLAAAFASQDSTT